jgi:hypothetical protein
MTDDKEATAQPLTDDGADLADGGQMASTVEVARPKARSSEVGALL